jgi:alpha-galactosidase
LIEFRDGVFFLSTANTSYWFAVTAHGHLEHLHYGRRLPVQDPQSLRPKRVAQRASAIAYEPADPRYTLDAVALEYSTIGQGDYRRIPCRILTHHGYDLDPVYRTHHITADAAPAVTLPTADGPAESLHVTVADERAGIELTLVYTVFEDVDVIARRVIVRNTGDASATIEQLASIQLDLPDRGLRVLTLDGDWIAETHAHTRPVTPGAFVTGSTTGSSSNRHNPGFLVLEDRADEDRGRVWGVNLVYSGSHEASVSLDAHGSVRVHSGIQPQAFAWPLAPGEEFESPQAVLTYSDEGCNGASDRFHRFVNGHIVPGRFRDVPRPVVFNSWEAVSFDVDERRLGRLAKQASGLGMELFVIDDGWFAGRRDDTGGLGDYDVDTGRFPSGLAAFGDRLKRLDLRMGLWFEPEMVNERSALYGRHPDWALSVPGKTPREGRHQLVLDLCNPDVCDYIVEQVGAVLDSADITYVKWDMNRHIADASSPHVPHAGMIAHRYIQNLYTVLERIFAPRPHVLLEMCSSGGNRFDLGMLRHSAMIWASDDTDPIERLEIQQGLSYLYPPSTISAHVSAAPHAQTLRDTPLSTRFNVAAFGALGYEYDLDLLTSEERKEIRDQIAFYLAHRELLQFGRFRRGDMPRDRYRWQVGEGDEAILGLFQRRADASPAPDILPIAGLDPDARYVVRSMPQRLMIERFGNLINHVTPVRLDPRGLVLQTVGRFHSLRDAAEEHRGTGSLLAEGVRLNDQFQGTEYNESIRMLGDHGSTLYTVEKDTLEKEAPR